MAAEAPRGPQGRRSAAAPLSESFALRPQHDALQAPLRPDLLAPEGSEIPAPRRVASRPPPALPEEIRLLRERGEALEDQLWRANQELARYQARYGDDALLEATEDGGVAPLREHPQWLTEPALVSPLLKAYDGRILEMGDAAARKDREYKAVQAQMEEVLAENELLRTQNEGYLEDMASKGFAGFGAADVAAEYQERIDALFAENGVLLQQNNVLKEEVARLQEYADGRNEEMASLTSVMQEAGEAVKAGEEKVRDLEAARAACEEDVLAKSSTIAELEELLRSARKALGEAQGQNARLVAQIADYKGTLLEKTRLLDSEREALTGKVRSGAERIHELQVKLSVKTEEQEATTKNLRDVRRELDSVRGDAEGMLQVITSLERQVEDFTAKESELTRLRRECHTKVEEALLARDRAQALERQARHELERQAERRRLHAEDQHLESAAEVSEVRTAMAKLLSNREAEYRSLLEDCAAAKAKCDLAKEGERAAERKYGAVAHEWETYKSSFELRTAQIEQKLTHAQGRAETAEAALQHRERELLQVRGEQGEYDDRSRVARDHLERERDVRAREVDRLRAQLREVTTAQERAAQETRVFQSRLHEARERMHSALEEVKLRRENEVQDLRLTIKRLETAIKDVEDKAARDAEAQRREYERTLAEREAQTHRLQRRVEEETEVAQRLGARNDELVDKLANETALREQLAADVRELKAIEADMEAELEDAERRIAQLSTQLADSLAEQQKLAKGEGRLKAEVSRMRIEMHRLERNQDLGIHHPALGEVA